MEMAAYVFEIVYDLAISLSNNVSDNPGLEGVNACCKNKLDKISFIIGRRGRVYSVVRPSDIADECGVLLVVHVIP